MRNALLRLDPSGETFTSLHLPYLQICLEMALYAEALPVLDRAIYNFPATTSSNLDGQYLCSEGRDSSAYITYKSELTTQIHYRQVQEYYLLGGIIYLALGPRRYEDARLCFEMVLMSPTQNVATGFMLEAYRKWLLLGVLIDGKSPDIPKGVAPTASRVLQAAAKPYLALTAAFEQKEVAKLKGEIDAGLKLWDEVSFLNGMFRTYY
jgi:COP9 signalosome complex subunit 3